MEKLRYIWNEINSSFWFIPCLMLFSAIAAAIGLIYLDTNLDHSSMGISRYIFSAGVDSARSILTIIAGAMIGIAGTVFSITLVALTLASSQLGSRLLRNFMYDRLNQIVLGTYVSTFVYCLIVVNTLTDHGDEKYVPVIPVFAGILFAIAGIILLVVFIHHISVSIQSDKVISDISESMSKNIRKLFPEQIGHEEEKPKPDVESFRKGFRFNKQILSPNSGYLQSVSSDKLLDLASSNDIVIILYYRPGDYLIKDMPICEVLGKEELQKQLHEKIYNTLITGKTRTPYQDAEYSIHQMVEIASRALSPGINDPYTAISCIDNLSSVLCYLTRANFPSPYRYDSDGKLRVIADNLTFKGMTDAAFNQIRQYAAGSPAVTIRLMEALVTISKFAQSKEHNEIISLHAQKVLRAAQSSFVEKRDIEDLEQRFQELKPYQVNK